MSRYLGANEPVSGAVLRSKQMYVEFPPGPVCRNLPVH